jgi:hypothetical protein
VRVEGIVQWSETAFGIVVDTAPGDIRQLAGDVFVLGSQWLGTGGFESGGSNQEESQGYELAKMVYAEQTRPIEKVSIPMNGNYGMFDITPDAMWFRLSFHPKQVLRDIDWTLKPFWCTGVDYLIDVEAGVCNTTLTALPETRESKGVSVWSQFGPDGKEKDWLPHAGSAKSVRALRAINTADGRIIPATMTMESAHPGTAIVRLYNDPAQTVVAECKNYKVISGRPVHVEINNRRSSSGRPGQQTYTVVGVREAQTYTEEAKDQRGYITRVATFNISGEALSQITEQCPPLKVVDATIFARKLHVIAVNAPSGGSAVFTVNLNEAQLGVVTLGDGVTSAETTLDETIMEDGDVLHLFVYGSAVDMPSLVVVEVECREYGL